MAEEDAESLAELQQEILSLRQQLGMKAAAVGLPQPHVETGADASTNGAGADSTGSSGSAGPLLPRRMEWERKRASPAASQQAELSLLQFNVLADGLCGLSPTLGDFSRPPKEVLDWGYRGPLLVAEMLRHNADVITSQEVDHFGDTFLPPLKRAGYAGLFHKKPCSPCLAFCEQEDGCALWYKASRLELVSYEAFQYSDRRGEEDEILNQGAQIATLRVIATGQLLIVANTHLKASKNAKGEVVRAMEAQQLLDTLATVKATAERNYGVASIPFLVAGDFNGTPTEDEGGDMCFKTCLAHPLGLRSAYPTTLDQPELYTTWKIRSKRGTPRGSQPPAESASSSLTPRPVDESEARNYIDYIFYGGGLAPPVGRLSIPDEDAIGADRLPSASWPSDHLSILAVFEL
jgi:nocturnin